MVRSIEPTWIASGTCRKMIAGTELVTISSPPRKELNSPRPATSTKMTSAIAISQTAARTFSDPAIRSNSLSPIMLPSAPAF